MTSQYEIANPSAKEMQALIDSPIDSAARASKVWLPLGKRSAPRASKANTDGIDEGLFPKATRADLAKRSAEAKIAKVQDSLAYYATTTVPFERVAEHTGLTLEEATAAMQKRGR